MSAKNYGYSQNPLLNEKQMNQLQKKAWFLILLVIFFVLHGTVENFGFIYFSALIKVAFTILISVGLFFLCIKIFIKNNIHAALIAFFISSWILFFGAIFDWVKSIYFLKLLHSYSLFLPFMLVTFILFILFIRKKISLQNKLCFYLNVLLLIYCLFDVSSIIVKSLKPNNKNTFSKINFDTTLVKTKPNVYFLLFDEYPGYKSLKDSFAFSNDKLYQFFADKEFKVLPTFSNYNITFYSLSSILNMQYINKSYNAQQIVMDNYQERLKELRSPIVVKDFESMGYSFINYSIFDILNKPSIENQFVVTAEKLITNKIFFNKIFEDLGWNLAVGRYKIPYFKYLFMQIDRNNKFIYKNIMEQKFISAPAPRFIYAHFILPHEIIFCDSAGNFLPDYKMFSPVSFTDKPTVLGYVKYTNTKIESLILSITKNDPKAIVVVMSDHGFRHYNNVEPYEPLQFDNICMVRFPDKNYLPYKEKWSTVNFFRYLFNCQFNQNIPYLKDSTIFLSDNNKNDAN